MTRDDDFHYPQWSDKDVASAARLAADWQAASERAFGVALQQPEVYQRTALIVGALVRRIREEGRGPGALVAAWERRRPLLEEVLADDARLGATRTDLELVAGAAFAMRYREVVAEIEAAQRLHRLATATPREGWVVLEESGFAAGDPFMAYRRVEAEPSTGRALLVTTRPDDTFTGCVHEIAVGRLDPASGEVAWDHESADDTFTEATSREAAVAALKRHFPG